MQPLEASYKGSIKVGRKQERSTGISNLRHYSVVEEPAGLLLDHPMMQHELRAKSSLDFTDQSVPQENSELSTRFQQYLNDQ